MSAVASSLWEKAVDALRETLDEESFSTWVEPIQFRDYADGQLTLSVPSVFFRSWLISNYQELIEQLLARMAERDIVVRYAVEPIVDGDANEEYNPPPAEARLEPVPDGSPNPFTFRVNRLNPHYTFENFVVGESNRFAYAATQAVADPDSKAYNPMFLYGGVGLGKTHLLHAIGHQLLATSPGKVALYVSSETFMNAFIDGIQKKDLTYFRNCFRTVDLLLIDDVQFFAGAERTQTEFFHTFNALFNAGKKIVITSDHPPKELPELEERLRSRFEAGLIVDIQPPDLETRVAILRKKAGELNLEFTPEIEIYIAERIKTNIRKLEGALTKLTAHRMVTGDPISMPLVRQLLGPFFTGEEPVKISVEKIQATVCRFFDITMQDMVGPNRARKFSGPRQIACYLVREMTELSFPDIARKFGNRDHTSIIHAHRKVQEESVTDLAKQNMIKYLTKLVKENSYHGAGD